MSGPGVDMPQRQRDVGSPVLLGALALTALALASPVVTLRSVQGAQVFTAEQGWFTPAPTPYGLMVALGGLGVVLALAARVRWWSPRRRTCLGLMAATWLATAGALTALDTAARTERMASVLVPATGLRVEVVGSWAPVLVMVAAALAAAGTLAPLAGPRTRPVPVTGGVQVWRMEA